MTTPADPPEPLDPHEPTDPPAQTDSERAGSEERQDRRAALAIVAVLVLALVVGLVWWLIARDSDEAAPTTTTTASTSTSEPTTTEPPEETTSSAPPTTFGSTLSEEELATVVWPDQGASRRFDDPTAAAHAFATDFLGFADPQLGAFAAGDQRSGEVEVRAVANGPVTTVVLRQLGDDTWWVLGAQTPDIVVDEPAPGSAIGTPVAVSGTARAFEGTVDVAVHRDGSDEPIGSGFVTGGAMAELEPFSGAVEFAAGDAEWGAVVFSTTSAEDGTVRQATVVRVGFG